MKAEDKSSGFPVNIFPPLIKDIIRETNAAFNYPVPYIGASLLCALASAIGNTCCLKVKSGWIRRISTPMVRGVYSLPFANMNLEAVYTPFLPVAA